MSLRPPADRVPVPRFRLDRDDGLLVVVAVPAQGQGQPEGRLAGIGAVDKIAALDVDGSLLSGALAAPLPGALVAAGLCPVDRLAALRAFLTSPDGAELESYASAGRAHELFAAMFTDVPCRLVAAVAEQVWQQRRSTLFAIVRPLVAALREHGFTSMLISGGPHEVLRHLAADLEIEHFHGTTFADEDGLYTGQVAADVISRKQQIAAELAAGQVSDWPRSLAIGNSLPDTDLLQRKGLPIVFEHSVALQLAVDKHQWPVADRHDLADALRDHAGIHLTLPLGVVTLVRC
ncbi:HAD family hydrolase [Streptomyces sp. NPDC001933]|uniref:HAD family hydrolase n=1 Tax=Streptomyces sp. NPDC001933 TaxID=3364626 RepID=UPI0036A5E909